MSPISDTEVQPGLLVQRPQPDPILLVQLPILQLGHVPRRCVHLAEPGAFLGYHSLIIGKNVHGKLVQPLQIPLVGGIFHCPLVVDVGEKITVFEIAIEVGRVAVILRGHQPVLRERSPRLALEQAVPAAANPVVGAALLELADTVVLAAEGDEIGHPRPVAPFHVGAQKLAALRKAECVDGRRGGEDRVRFEVSTHLHDLLCKVPKEGGSAVSGSVVIEADVIGECARIGFVHEGADGTNPLGIVAGEVSEN